MFVGDEKILNDLVETGFSVTDNFFSPDIIQHFIEEGNELLSNGAFRKAGIGPFSQTKVISEIRGDQIYWFSEHSLSSTQIIFWKRMEELKQLFNRELYCGINEMEFHYAVYPENSFYKKHLDRFKEKGTRKISCILYLNHNWKIEYGGQLRVYHENSFTDILPEAGRFVCFRSDIIEHEVMVTRKERRSITGWMKG